MLPETLDITAITGKEVSGPVAAWRDTDAAEGRLAGISPSGELLFFSSSPEEGWVVRDLSRETGQGLATPVVAWRTPLGSTSKPHLAGISSTGDLVVFSWPRPLDWLTVNVTEQTGQRIVSPPGLPPATACPVTAWQVGQGSRVESHLAGLNSAGELLTFSKTGDAAWQALNVSAEIGHRFKGYLTGWTTGDVEHVAGVESTTDDLLVCFRTPGREWRVVNVSEKTGERLLGPIVSWQVAEGGLNHEKLAGVSPAGDLLVFAWSPSRDWNVLNISHEANVTVAGSNLTIAAWQTDFLDGRWVEHLACHSDYGNTLSVFFRHVGEPWCAINTTAMTQIPTSGSISAWQTQDSRGNIENLATAQTNRRLRVISWRTGDIAVVRIHAVKVSDTDTGLVGNIDEGVRPRGLRETRIKPEEVRRWVERANEVFGPAGIQFLFDPRPGSPDFEPLRNTDINNLACANGSNPDEAARLDKAQQHAGLTPDKIVAFFRWGPETIPTGVGCAGVGAFEIGSDYRRFILMPGFWNTHVCGRQNKNILAHEMGHYLGLAHTFYEFERKRDAEQHLASHGNDPVSAFDADRTNNNFQPPMAVEDTPPDLEIKEHQLDLECSSRVALDIGGQLVHIDRTNVMSYGGDAYRNITPDQIAVMRRILIMRQAQGLWIGKP
ncbi:MAG: hypothetical protein QGG42_15220 [Phycisphaerae bacterium]|jgi:hypothetical protein|nr:hypothetical protein [Phycisphaerae bacterium]